MNIKTVLSFAAKLSGLALFAASSAMAQSFAVEFQAGILRDRFGNPLSDGSLVLLVADTGDNGFTSLLAGSDLSVGSFLNSDDQILFRAVVDSDQFGVGSVVGSANLIFDEFPTLEVGHTLSLIWFSSVTGSSLTLTGGEDYGLFSAGVEDDWIVPSASSLVELSFVTQAAEGSYSDSLSIASFSVIPEPSTYAALLGIASLGFAALHRRRFRR